MSNKEYEYPFDENFEEEVAQDDIDDSDELPPKDIIAFNELRSCADLLRMYKSNQLDIQPYFQREVVWSKPAQTRFVDSLIKQLPIPSMCVSFDFDKNERYVIDGLQRIQTIINFLSKDEWELSSLEDIDKKISGKSVRSIKKQHKAYYDRVQNLTIPITVIRCSHSKEDHLEYLFTIFHRLNSGGSKLNNQEIRNCIYSGSFNELLQSLVKHPDFVSLFGIQEDKKYRFAFEELSLRFLAFSNSFETYNGKLSRWLNDYMFKKRDLDDNELGEIRTNFQNTITLIYQRVLHNNALGKISKSLIEGLYVGVNRNLQTHLNSQEDLQVRFEELKNDALFSTDALKEGVAQKTKVIERLTRAVEIFQ